MTEKKYKAELDFALHSATDLLCFVSSVLLAVESGLKFAYVQFIGKDWSDADSGHLLSTTLAFIVVFLLSCLSAFYFKKREIQQETSSKEIIQKAYISGSIILQLLFEVILVTGNECGSVVFFPAFALYTLPIVIILAKGILLPILLICVVLVTETMVYFLPRKELCMIDTSQYYWAYTVEVAVVIVAAVLLLVYRKDLRRLVAETAGAITKLTEEELKVHEVFYNHKMLQYEIDVAKTIQEAFYPKEADMNHGIFDVYAKSIASEKVSGDYYDIYAIGEDLFFGIGDVTGHGLSSSIISIIVNRKIRTYLELGITDVKRIIKECNKEVAGANLKGMLLAIGKISAEKRVTIYGKCCGLLLLRKDTGVKVIETGKSQNILGSSSFDKEEINVWSQDLKSGDTIIMFTDGVSGAEDSFGKPIGIDKVAKHVEEIAYSIDTFSAKQIALSVVSMLQSWSKKTIPEDDSTILVLKVK